MEYLPSLYKCRTVPVKSPVCAICLDRTRGRTQVRELTHGVRISLCEGHHSVAFMRRNAGRDFAVTLSRMWSAQGCLTRARSRALAAHLNAVRALGTRIARARPGSYAWPRLRREAEEHFARGDGVIATILRLRDRHARDHAKVPSIRTMRRWFAQGRWLRRPEPATARRTAMGTPPRQAERQSISSGSSFGGEPSASRQARISGGSLFSETIR
ncbi:MAG TPA: hypothetical protein VFD90_12995 [Gaiellales bacterium]|nr:hypothetical protein [Gaiellales bacterium]